MKRPLMVTDAGLGQTGVFERVRSMLPDAPVYSGVDPNPTEQNVLEGLAVYREHGCDSVIGIGGGSPLDVAKAIRLKATHALDLAEYDALVDGGHRIGPDLPPYIAIATTAGSGSEVARAIVVKIPKTGRKTVIVSPQLMPSLAIDDPELTVSMPAHITAGSGMDAFTHNVEAYLSTIFHPICDAIAIAGARMVSENLPRVMRDPNDMEARGNMMLGAIMGATAFQKGLGATHSLAHPLSSDFGLHHGTANAVLLPWVLEFNRPFAAARLNDLAQALGSDPVERARELARICGIAPRLRDYGVAEEALEALSAKGIDDICHRMNPRPVSREDLLALYRAAW